MNIKRIGKISFSVLSAIWLVSIIYLNDKYPDVEWEWKNNQTNTYLGSLEEGRLDNLNEIIDLSIKLNLPKKYGSENIYFDFDEITLTDCKEVQ